MSAPVTVEWTSRDVIDWFATLGIGPGLAIDVLVVAGPYFPETPDRMVVVTCISGAPSQMDEDLEIPGFQLLVRGPTADPVWPERTAKQIDRLIRFAEQTDVAGGAFRLISALRRGGGPAVLGGEDSGDCTLLTCTYLVKLMR